MSSVVKDTHHDEHPSGIMRWITTTNHKDIGTLYLWFAMVMFFIGGLMALVIRSELFQPGLQFVDPQFFNSMTTMHALVMIFGVVMPAFTGLANWMIPIMIGGPVMDGWRSPSWWLDFISAVKSSDRRCFSIFNICNSFYGLIFNNGSY